ncbi:PAS domain-containing protein [Lacipirellula limnantheis]|uniref:histidine kinase n=1 Tax=Lacipirellula limnantheis TaxID=2528024 RepID=A0A517TZ78_9BACT|nr:PAS domain-containing protein [Lacipirellula limnantheis]QDT73683.1 Aerobic respiration control sensor protein ArcB [Lacipirellula limnantheis]
MNSSDSQMRLPASPRHLYLALSGADLGMWEWNIATGQLIVNARWHAMLGLDPNGPMPTIEHWNSCVHPDDIAILDRICSEVIFNAAGCEFEADIRARHCDGSYIWIRDKGAVIERDEDGRPLRVVGTHLDITNLKLAEGSARETEARFRRLADTAPVGIWMTDRLGKCTYVNSCWQKVAGVSLEEALGDGWSNGLHPDDRERVFAEWLQGASTAQPWNQEYRFQNRDGRTTYVLGVTGARRDDQGQTVGYIGVNVDITQRKEAEAQLAATTELLESTGRMARVGGWEVDLRTTVQTWSRQTFSIFDMEPADEPSVDAVIGLFASDAQATIRAAIAAAINAGQSYDLELPAITAKGRSIWVRTQGTPVRFGREVVGLRGTIQDITDRKVAELQLSRQESHNRALLSANPDLIFTNRRDGTFLAVHAPDPGVLCASAESLLGMNVSDALPGPIARQFLEAFVGADSNVEPRQINFALHVRGCVRHLEARIVSAGDHTVVSIIRDVTAAKQMEGAIRSSEERLQFALDATSDGIWDWNIHTGVAFYSPQWAKLLEYPPDEVEGNISFFRELLHPEEAEQIENHLDGVANGTVLAHTGELRLRTKSGEFRWFLDRSRVVMQDEFGLPLRMVGTISDITERKVSEQRIAESERRFRRLADSCPMLIWTSDVNGGFDFVNEYWRELTGQRPESLLGDHWIQGLHPDDAEPYLGVYRASFEKRCEFQTEFRLLRNDGSFRVFMCRGVPRTTDSGAFEGYVGACVDVSELREMQLKADAASKAKSEFLAQMSHEFRTPLNAIIGFSTNLLRSDDCHSLDNRQRDRLTRIQRNGQHLLLIVNQLLDTARIEAGQLTVSLAACDVREVIYEVAAVARPLLEDRPDVKLLVEVIGNCPAFHSDRGKCHQILLNLVSNAIKFTKKGEITIRASIDGELLRFAVSDTGIGIAADDIPRVFELFYRTNTKEVVVEGTGLGLHISTKLAALIGGRITVTSTLGKGSTFVLTIPMSPIA